MRKQKIAGWIMTLFLFGGSAWLLSNHFMRCRKPISYSVASVDPRFLISKEDFSLVLRQAITLWEDAAGKRLFLETETGGKLIVRAIYDYRQETREKISEVGVRVDEEKQSYETVKLQYEEAKERYDRALASYNALKKQHDARRAAFDREVESLLGIANKADIERLEKDRDSINAMVDKLNVLRAEVKKCADETNVMIGLLNQSAEEGSVSYLEYQELGETMGEEYESGLFEGRAGERGSISVYSFADQDELRRLLAHELGHALGLQHLDDPKAIMYRLNEMGNDVLSETDRSSLSELCSARGGVSRLREAVGLSWRRYVMREAD